MAKIPSLKKSIKAFHGIGKTYVKKAIMLAKKHSKDKSKQKKMIKQIKEIEKSLHELKKLAGGK
ncbi:MAG: hypothetical protein QW666_01130 [Candidatus Woesearchaeota archaeon]